MRSNERGDPCTHPVRPPYPNNCLLRGRQVVRAEELGRSGCVSFDACIDRGVFPVEDVADGDGTHERLSF